MHDFNFLSNIQYCKEIVDSMTNMLLYSHIPITIIVLAIGIYVSIYNKTIFSRILLFMAIVFSLWTTLNIGIWLTYGKASILMSLWAPIEFFAVILFILNFIFIYIFIKKTNIPKWIPIVSFLVLIPIIIALPTIFNLSGYDLGQCIAIESSSLQKYVLYLKIFVTLATLGMIIYGYFKSIDKTIRKQILLLGLGTIIFFLTFFVGGYISDVTSNYSYEFYGLSGMIFFMAILVNLIVRFKMFGIKMITGQVLVLSLVVLIGSLLFVVTSLEARIITTITLFLVIILGYVLIRSIHKEIKQREHIEKLAQELEQSKLRVEEANLKLEDANEKLKGLDKLKTEFLSLASHQLRSPLTAIKGYTSMLMEGDYGTLNPKIKEVVDRVFQSCGNLIQVVEDLLNISKIESGGMKYEKENFDLAIVASEVAKDISVTAEQRGLKLNYKQDKENHNVFGDKNKLRQVMNNLIDNSIKYTKEGSVNVSVTKVKNKIRFEVKDTGMGVTPEIKATLFQKFARGDGSRMNTGGSGLGLYLVKQIVDGHKGKVDVDSEGPGKGSTFYMELDAVQPAT